MSLGTYACRALLNSFLGKTSDFGALASAPTIYVALSSTDPGEDGSGVTEPSGGSYARVATAASDWNAATLADPSLADNANAITFPTATADWLGGADLTWVALFDAASGGNYLGRGQLAAAKPVGNGSTALFPAGTILLSFD